MGETNNGFDFSDGNCNGVIGWCISDWLLNNEVGVGFFDREEGITDIGVEMASTLVRIGGALMGGATVVIEEGVNAGRMTLK